METMETGIPWGTLPEWNEANASLAYNLEHNHSRMVDAVQQAQTLGRLLTSLFPLMDDLCAATCPDCTDICCQRAWVWIDFRDLLFLHLAAIPVPERQLVSQRGDHCRYAGPCGCRLSRIQRPFVCTWYICPAQTRLLDSQPDEKRHLSSTIKQIKALRKQVEGDFIRVVF